MNYIDSISQSTLFLLQDYDELFHPLFEVIAGEEGCNVKRWRSLQYMAPYDLSFTVDFGGLILGFPAPNLRFLDLKGEECIDSALQEYSTFSSLESMKLTDVLISHPPPCLQLRHLHIVLGPTYDWSDLTHLRRFPRLIDATIQIPRPHWDDLYALPNVNPNVDEVFIADLDHLRLASRFSNNVLNVLKCNRLRQITIDHALRDDEKIGESTLLPIVEHFVYNADLEEAGEDRPTSLSDILRHLLAAHTVQVPHNSIDKVLQIVASLLNEGLLHSLQRIIACDEGSGHLAKVYTLAEDRRITSV